MALNLFSRICLSRYSATKSCWTNSPCPIKTSCSATTSYTFLLLRPRLNILLKQWTRPLYPTAYLARSCDEERWMRNLCWIFLTVRGWLAHRLVI